MKQGQRSQLHCLKCAVTGRTAADRTAASDIQLERGTGMYTHFYINVSVSCEVGCLGTAATFMLWLLALGVSGVCLAIALILARLKRTCCYLSHFTFPQAMHLNRPLFFTPSDKKEINAVTCIC